MSDEIVSRLMRNHKKLEFLCEDLDPLYEADADEEYAALNAEDDDEEEEEHDDSQAPIQGKPDDDIPPEENAEDKESEEDSEDTSIDDAPSISTRGGVSNPMSGGPEIDRDDTMKQTPPERDKDIEGALYENPLDNQYAVKFTLGDDVSLDHSGDTNEIKTGVVDGYDPEGFYRIKWSDGTTTNGITDIALAEFVRTQKADENVCICGGSKLVEENNYIVCDCCGRKLRESTLDALTIADKSRPKGKRMIRSEAHPMSTSAKPNIAVAESLVEDEDIDKDLFDDIHKLDNEFWTRKNELLEDIEGLGYEVDEINDEYVVISHPDDDYNALRVPIGGTSRSFYLDLDKSRMI